MDIQRFERWVRRLHLVPVEKEITDRGTICLAEGYFDTKEDGPHYRLFWGVVRSEAEVGRLVYVPAYQTVRGINRPVTREERIQIAVADAVTFLRDGQSVGGY